MAKFGPVSVGLDAGGDGSFQFYKSGIFRSDICTTVIDHALLAVGYGSAATTTKKARAPTSAGTGNGDDARTAAAAGPYWILKNQWSTSWGIDGYVWLAKGINMCGVAEYCSYILA